jgi:ligand-binding sensor domain-containing protein
MNRIIFRLMIAFWCVNGIGQHTQSEYALDYISTEAGLPHNYVSKIVSDSLNVKWIAQETGVTRYDGQIFTKIEPGPEYPDLKNENIETLYFDSKNRLWIGTKSGGISMLDIRTNKLVNYNNIIASDLNGILRIISIEEDAFGNLWFGSVHNGLFVFNPHTKELIKKLPGKLINAILKDSNGNVWYASGLNLRRVDHSTGKVSIIRFDQEINSVIEDKSRNCLWIATYHSPDQAARYIYKLDLGSNEIIKVDTGIDHYYFKSMALDRFDRLWIGTWGKGVYRSNSTLNKFEKINLVNSKNSQKSINYQNIIDIHIDKNNVVWLATTFAGIVKLTESKGFENIDVIVENPILVNELNFQSVFRDDENIWLGTIQSGLFKGTD